MRFNLLKRKVHYWVASAAALPVLIIVCSGILLQLKKDLAWIQPPEKRGAGTRPSATLEQVLAACRSPAAAAAGVEDWKDIERIDLRPAKGLLKVTTTGHWEIQIDAETAAVLQVAYRRSDFIESIHDGSWFHRVVKTWIFLPAAVALLILWVTGILLFLQPFRFRARR